MIFSHSGHLGDVLYSLPAVKILTDHEEAVMIIKAKFEDRKGAVNHNTGEEGNNYNQVDALKDLLLAQSFISEVREYRPPPGYDGDEYWEPKSWAGVAREINYDLDRSRDQHQRKTVFHVKRYFDTFGISADDRVPWLEIDEEPGPLSNFFDSGGTYAIFHVTEHWNGFIIDWTKVYYQALAKYDKVYFTGYRAEYENFERHFSTMIDYLPTKNLLELARTIRDAGAVYTNQNCALVIAQGLGKKYFLVPFSGRTHCIMKTVNENILP